MDTVLDRPWTADGFLAWEDQQEGRHEFDGRRVIPMTGGSVAHQRIVLNLCIALVRLTQGSAVTVIQEMRLRIGERVRYSDVLVAPGPLDPAARTLNDALAIFEVASDDTAATDRVAKLSEYTAVPSLRCYVLLEQTAVAATLYQRAPGGPWIATAHTDGEVALPGLDITLPLADLYQGLNLGAPTSPP